MRLCPSCAIPRFPFRPFPFRFVECRVVPLRASRPIIQMEVIHWLFCKYLGTSIRSTLIPYRKSWFVQENRKRLDGTPHRNLRAVFSVVLAFVVSEVLEVWCNGLIIARRCVSKKQFEESQHIRRGCKTFPVALCCDQRVAKSYTLFQMLMTLRSLWLRRILLISSLLEHVSSSPGCTE